MPTFSVYFNGSFHAHTYMDYSKQQVIAKVKEDAKTSENVKQMNIRIVSEIEKNEEGKCWCYATYNGRKFILEFPGLLPRIERDKEFSAYLKVGKDKCYYIGA